MALQNLADDEQRKAPRSGWQRCGVPLLFLALVLFGLGRATALRWACDDSFLCFRYAENLVEGRGLVYNEGEYVEGYTNLLWTLALALSIKTGASPVTASQVLGIVCYVALAACLLRWTWRRSRGGGRHFLPLAAGLVLVCPDFHVWATGGLETMLFAWLSTQALLLTLTASGSWRTPLLAGVLYGLLVLTRPDGLLLAGVGVLSYWIPGSPHPRARRRTLSMLTGLPVVVTVAALASFKLAYYGDLFPTAFYSKSVADPYYSQGFVYVGLFLAGNWFLPSAFLAMFVVRRLRWGRGSAGVSESLLPLLGAAGLFLAYLVHVGGDFMFARRVLPVAPLLFVALEELLSRLKVRRVQVVLASLFVVAAAFPYPLYSDQRPRIRGIADERRFYPARVMEVRRRQAEAVADALAGTDVRLMFEGGMLVFGYYSKLPYLVEMTGLTQYSLARLPITARGYIGHEKSATDEWLDEHDIHLVVSHDLPPVRPPPGPRAYNEIYFGALVKARILRYSEPVMNALGRFPQVSFLSIEDLLEQAKEGIRQGSRAEAEETYRLLDRYYFRSGGENALREARALRELVDAKVHSPR